MRPVRILVDAIHARSGGGVTQLRNLLIQLANDDEFEVHVVLHADQRALLDLPGQIAWHEVTFRNGFYKRLMWEQFSLPSFARRIGAEVTYAQANYGPLLAPGLVISLVNTTEVSRGEKRLAKRLYWAALSIMTLVSVLAARRVIAISEHVARTLVPFDFVWRKVTIIPPGIDPCFFAPDRATNREQFLLAVGDFYVQKNYPRLADAFARLAPHFPELRLWIAGDVIDQHQADIIQATASRHGVAHRITVLGRQDRDQLVDLYRRCAVFVFPSTAEAFGIPLAEAMAAGAPIAASNRSAVPEVAGPAAEYFDPANPAEMADVIERVLTDAALRQRLATAGAERSIQFVRGKVASAIAGVFKLAAGRSI